jgi:hypothetical protein
MAEEANGGRVTLSKTKDVTQFEYPPKVTLGSVLKGLWQTSKLDLLFHSLMAILLVTGLAIDLLGVFLGGALTPIRQILHGYIGTIFTIIYPFYLIKILVTRKMRLLLTGINYLDFLLYTILIVTGVTVASANQIWVDTMPWLTDALSSLRQYAPAVHTVTTYVWLLISTLLPGGFLHGIATAYIISIKGGHE